MCPHHTAPELLSRANHEGDGAVIATLCRHFLPEGLYLTAASRHNPKGVTSSPQTPKIGYNLLTNSPKAHDLSTDFHTAQNFSVPKRVITPQQTPKGVLITP